MDSASPLKPEAIRSSNSTILAVKKSPYIEKVKPIVFGPEILTYLGLGKYLGQAFSIGKEL
jgi:hypothetical protein